MSTFHFLRPLWFLLLPPLLGLLWLLWNRRLRSRSWQEICDPALLPHLLLGRSRRRANWPLWLMLASLLTTVIALAGPTWRQLPQPLFRQQSALVICFDLSRSMLAADIKPNRLVRARLKIQDILRERREGQTALVAFAGDAFAITPLTEDYRTIDALLGTLEPGLMPVQGSAPQRALALAAELLNQAGLKDGTILLVTDEDRPQVAEEAGRQLQTQGLQLQVLGVGTLEGAPIPLNEGGFYKDNAGNMVLPRLDEAALRQLAAAGGGSYRRLSIDDSDFHTLLADLQSKRLDHAESARSRLGDRWQEAGVWLLWPLALLAACAFRRGWLLALLLILFTPPQASAMSWQELWQRPDQHAVSAFVAGQFEAAADRFADPRWKASALYRAGRYDDALKVLPEGQSADDWYNRGNAEAQSGQLAAALKSYDQALKLKPGDDDTLTNRKLVEQALQQQEQQQQEKQEKQQGESQSKDQQGQAEDQQSGKDDRKQQGQNDMPGQGSPGQNDPPPTPEQSAGQESKSEAEQPQPGGEQSAEKLQQAQQSQPADQQPPDKNQAAAAANSEPPSAEERETQQLLQGIPDDPGGLLRRKFLYQYRSRGEQLETDRPW
jgi:Ca-activated chloride channel family protein